MSGWPPRFPILPALMYAAWLWNRSRIPEARQAGEVGRRLDVRERAVAKRWSA
jgi:hypothetical protein